MSEAERQAWRIDFRLECVDEHEAEIIFNAFQSCLEEIHHTHWSSTMGRDLNMEKALKSFRANKESILASLPDSVVEHYYPESKSERHLEVVPEPEIEE
jgi:hypothetical protein|tara:strand:+ start:128 stop:424 length:297 start_codon:yes stop_codon:yes gene_type:complete